MLPALDGTVGHLAIGQRHGLVGALVAACVHSLVAADYAYRALADIHVHRLVLSQFGQRQARTQPSVFPGALMPDPFPPGAACPASAARPGGTPSVCW